MENKLDGLYREYGKLGIELEIIQGRTLEVNKAIAQELNKPRGNKAPTKVEKTEEPITK